jgi:hypothetical protein
VPIVTASDCSRSTLTSHPFSNPTAPPIASTASSDVSQPVGPPLVVATTTLAMAMTPMPERSNSAVSTVMVSPAAAIASTTVSLSKLLMPNWESAPASLIA